MNNRSLAEDYQSHVRELPIDLVQPNPDQPRKLFDAKSLQELADSIEQHGLLQPIKVRPRSDGKYTIVLGERRWRAHKLLGRQTILAAISELSDDDLADQAIIENLQRQDITPLEEARAFQARLDTGITVEQLAHRLGLKQPWRITERTSLLKLEPQFQDALARGIITPLQALEMSRLGKHSQKLLFDAIATGRCKTAGELRSAAGALLDAERQVAMFDSPRPSNSEFESVSRVERKIEKVIQVLREGFDGNDLVILRRVNPLRANVLADQLALIETAVRQMRLACAAAGVAGGFCSSTLCDKGERS